MGIKPKIPPKRRTFLLKKCARCNQEYGPDDFAPSKSFFFPDQVLPICNNCIKEILISEEFNWAMVDKICQMADIPFVPREFERLHDSNGDDVFPVYARVFQGQEYESIGWDDYFKEFKTLKETKLIEDELPEIGDEKIRKLRQKWGDNYDTDQLIYLEDLYNGMLVTQNINGALQIKQAQQLCMMSLELESRIRAGVDFDKLLSSYDKLVKVAEFTPKNVKNANDFDSVGELIKWLEKRGWKNKFYDGVTRDVIDETIKNIQNYNQRLYINESGIGEEISRRIEQLKIADEAETDYYGLGSYDSLDDYDNEGYEQLMKEDNEFRGDI